MRMVEILSSFFAEWIALKLKLDKDREEVFQYGAFVFFQTIWSLFLIVVFGLIFHVVLEILIISVSAAMLRKYSGGVHATSANRCAILGMLFFGILALFVRIVVQLNLSKPIIFVSNIILVSITYSNVVKYAPIDSINKPITQEHKKQELKRKSLKVIYLFAVALLILGLIYFSFDQEVIISSILCISFGLAWQSFTLTLVGNGFISTIDSIFLSISKRWEGKRYEE